MTYSLSGVFYLQFTVFFQCHLEHVDSGFMCPLSFLVLFQCFQVGLGINTMQGREAKHQKLGTYAEFSLPKERWEKVLLHEHMSLIWLWQNPHLVKYSKLKLQYIPKRCYTREFCFFQNVRMKLGVNTVSLFNGRNFCMCCSKKDNYENETYWNNGWKKYDVNFRWHFLVLLMKSNLLL